MFSVCLCLDFLCFSNCFMFEKRARARQREEKLLPSIEKINAIENWIRILWFASMNGANFGGENEIWQIMQAF